MLLSGAALILNAAPSHAADDDKPGGLSGLVSSVTSELGNTVGGTVSAVGHIVKPVAPVTEKVAEVTQNTTAAVAETVEATVEAVPAVTPIVEPVITEVVQPIVEPVVEHVAQPVLDTVAEVTEPLPVVGTVVAAIDLDKTVAALPTVTEAVDATVGGVLTGATPQTGTDPSCSILGTCPAVPGVEPSAPVSPDGDSTVAPSVPDAAPVAGPAPVTVTAADAARDAAETRARDAREALASAFTTATAVPASPATQAAATHAEDDNARGDGNGSRDLSQWPANMAPAQSGANAGGFAPLVPFAGDEFSAIELSAFGVVTHDDDRIPACPVFEADTSPD